MHAAISSITSKDVRTTVVTLSLDCIPHTLDGTLHGLVEKVRTMGCKHTLEAEFRTSGISDTGLDYRVYFPKFKEKGRVRMLNTLSGECFRDYLN